MSNSLQDGEPGTSTAPPSERKYSTRQGAATQDGTDFQIKMCALVFLRAVRSNSSFTDFTIKMNYGRAGAFGTIVFSYWSAGEEQNILVQLRTSPRTLNLLSPENKSLNHYFQKLKKLKTSQHFENITYVFLTNADVELKSKVAIIDSPTKKLLCTTWKPEDVFQVDLTHNVCEGFKNDIGAEDFVNRLLIFRNQSSLKCLDEFIKQELFKIRNGFVPEYRVIQQNFVENIKAWWGERTKPPLDNKWKGWIELFDQIKLPKHIQFCKDTLSDLEERVLNSKCDIILLKCEKSEAQIACSKVYQTCVRKEHHRVLFTDISEQKTSLEMLFNLWLDDIWNVLVITDVTNCSQNLGEIITNFKYNLEKKIVIVSSSDANKLGLSKAHEIDPDVIKSSFNQLDDESQDFLRNLPVDFQGKSIALGNVQGDKVLDGGLLQSVLTSPKIEIGGALPACDGTYIPRTLSKRLLVNEGILNSNERVICDVTEECINLSILKATDEGTLREQGYSFKRSMDYSEMHKATHEYRCPAEKLSEDPVHFLQVIDNSLYWFHSRGSTDNLYKYIEWWPREEEDCKKLIRDIRSWRPKDEDLVKHEFQTIIVAEEAGSGKTALLRKVANKMKELYPHRWIINIDLNKQSEILDKMRIPFNVTRENIIDLLSNAANTEDSEFGKKLLEYHVSKSGDICLLFDAFDEIMPSYTDTVLNILKLICNDFRLSTLWVATRYYAKDKLECLLETKAFRIEPLSEQEQFQYMSKLLGEEKAKKVQKQVLNKLPERDGFRISSFPLHLEMICQMDPNLFMSDNLSRINIIHLYEQFIEQKFDLYFSEKARINSPYASNDDIRENLREDFMNRHMICSLVVLDYMLKYIDKSQQSSIAQKVKKICEEIVEGKERLGIIDGVVHGKPHFIHRTFAEWFAGKWLAKHWEKNKVIIMTITYEARNDIVNKAFCQELASKLPAHLAVLNGDINALKEHKEYLNDTDALGRTPLHLAIMMEDKDEVEPLMVLELLKYRPNLEIREYLNALTPVYLAAQMHCRHIVTILLQHGASPTQVHPAVTPKKVFMDAIIQGAWPLGLDEPERNMIDEAVKDVGRSGQ
ncbi:uncharacterized protein [Anabrus simplex]|uniref:uncharacterized protein n=1 Tax=Anabrus simplex TaxID=316456 RepID=UPI0035A31555